MNRYIVQGQLSDGKPGYWGSGEWHADKERAKLYKLHARAAQVALEYGGEVVTLTSELKNESVYAYDLLCVIRDLRLRISAKTDWNNSEYLIYRRGTTYAYTEAVKLLSDLLEEQGIDVETELTFI